MRSLGNITMISVWLALALGALSLLGGGRWATWGSYSLALLPGVLLVGSIIISIKNKDIKATALVLLILFFQAAALALRFLGTPAP